MKSMCKIVIYLLSLVMAQGRMHGAPNENETHNRLLIHLANYYHLRDLNSYLLSFA